MEKFTTHTGTGLPLRRSNVDTDQIIPAVYLKRVTRTGFEDGLFGAWRNDPEFVLNQPERSGRHRSWSPVPTSAPAPRASTRSGRCRTTASRSSSPPLRRHLPRQLRQGRAARRRRWTPEVVEQLWALIEADPAAEVTVDLEAREVRAGDLVAPFEHRRLHAAGGCSRASTTSASRSRTPTTIAAFEATRPSWKPATL